MSRTLLVKDNITVIGEILKTGGLVDKANGVVEEVKPNNSLKLTFILLINGKQRVWETHYELEGWELKSYNAWNDIKDFLCTIGYDLEEANIRNWIEQFEINSNTTLDVTTNNVLPNKETYKMI